MGAGSTFQYRRDDAGRALPLERPLPSRHFVQHRAHRENVAPGIGFFALRSAPATCTGRSRRPCPRCVSGRLASRTGQGQGRKPKRPAASRPWPARSPSASPRSWSASRCPASGRDESRRHDALSPIPHKSRFRTSAPGRAATGLSPVGRPAFRPSRNSITR